jgi:hypothetical protein
MQSDLLENVFFWRERLGKDELEIIDVVVWRSVKPNSNIKFFNLVCGVLLIELGEIHWNCVQWSRATNTISITS